MIGNEIRWTIVALLVCARLREVNATKELIEVKRRTKRRNQSLLFYVFPSFNFISSFLLCRSDCVDSLLHLFRSFYQKWIVLLPQRNVQSTLDIVQNWLKVTTKWKKRNKRSKSILRSNEVKNTFNDFVAQNKWPRSFYRPLNCNLLESVENDRQNILSSFCHASSFPSQNEDAHSRQETKCEWNEWIRFGWLSRRKRNACSMCLTCKFLAILNLPIVHIQVHIKSSQQWHEFRTVDCRTNVKYLCACVHACVHLWTIDIKNSFGKRLISEMPAVKRTLTVNRNCHFHFRGLFAMRRIQKWKNTSHKEWTLTKNMRII